MGGGFSKLVDRDSGNLYPIYLLFPDILSQLGGGGCNVFFLAFYAISSISRKKTFWEDFFFFRKTILFHLMFSSCFCMLDLFPTFLEFCYFFGNIEKFPFTYWLNGRWFLQIVDRDSGNLYPIYIKTKIVVLASEPVVGRSRATELPCWFYLFWRERQMTATLKQGYDLLCLWYIFIVWHLFKKIFRTYF